MTARNRARSVPRAHRVARHPGAGCGHARRPRRLPAVRPGDQPARGRPGRGRAAPATSTSRAPRSTYVGLLHHGLRQRHVALEADDVVGPPGRARPRSAWSSAASPWSPARSGAGPPGAPTGSGTPGSPPPRCSSCSTSATSPCAGCRSSADRRRRHAAWSACSPSSTSRSSTTRSTGGAACTRAATLDPIDPKIDGLHAVHAAARLRRLRLALRVAADPPVPAGLARGPGRALARRPAPDERRAEADARPSVDGDAMSDAGRHHDRRSPRADGYGRRSPWWLWSAGWSPWRFGVGTRSRWRPSAATQSGCCARAAACPRSCRRGAAMDLDLTPRTPADTGATAQRSPATQPARGRPARPACSGRSASSSSAGSATRRSTSTTPTRRSAQQDELGDRRFRLQGTVRTTSSRPATALEFTVAFNGVSRRRSTTAATRPSCSSPASRWCSRATGTATCFASDRILVKHSEEYKAREPGPRTRRRPVSSGS